MIQHERALGYLTPVVALGAIYVLLAAFMVGLDEATDLTLVRSWFFGFTQLGRLGAPAAFGVVATVPCLVFVLSRRGLLTDERMTSLNNFVYTRPLVLAGIVVFFTALFFAFPTRFLNSDGMEFEHTFSQEVPEYGLYAAPDELLELAVESYRVSRRGNELTQATAAC